MRKFILGVSAFALALTLPVLSVPTAAQADGMSCKMARQAYEKACGVKKAAPKKKKKRVAARKPEVKAPVEVAAVPPAPEAPKSVEVTTLSLDNGFFAGSGGVGPVVDYYGGGGGTVILSDKSMARAPIYVGYGHKPKPKPPAPCGGCGGCGGGCGGGHK